MKRNYYMVILLMILVAHFVFGGAAANAQFIAGNSGSADELRDLEQQGIENAVAPIESGKYVDDRRLILVDSLPNYDVLLIPNSTDDNVGMYDPEEGTFLGIYITGHSGFSTPICAMPGPDNNIYVSDQVADAVFVFDRQGDYLSTYADATDGLNNIRGIDFKGAILCVTSGDDYIAQFEGPHNRIADFVTGGMDPFDIEFLPDGSALVSDITGDNVRLYDAGGNFVSEMFSVDFPEQINPDVLDDSSYLNSAFLTGNIVHDFEVSGIIQQTTPWNDGRGVYRLGNGNLLTTSGLGVYEIVPGTGQVVQQENTGGARFIELVTPPQSGTSDIDLSRTMFVDTVVEGSSINRDLHVGNQGDAQLVYGLHGDETWISVAPDTGNVPNSGVDTVVVTFDAGSLTPGTYNGNVTVNSNDPDEGVIVLPVTLVVEQGGGGCPYVIGDINNNGDANGVDVTYGVNYFKGFGPPPAVLCADCPNPGESLYGAGDVNGNCQFNGVDITYFVNYLKGIGPALSYCTSCPPAR